ncbi:hypothetical protein [Carnobacterium alterfunditum]|uniref:hypothetical protein n=1 Tax=Carnobacterium alterfunditum TaxID=28230 RepID=UPI003594948E
MSEQKDPIEFTKELLKNLSEEYKERLILLYPEAYEENPEAFLFSDFSNLDSYIIRANEKLLTYKHWIFIYQGTGILEDLGEIEEATYSELKNYGSSNEFIRDTINKNIGIERQLYFYDMSMLNAYLKSTSTAETFIETNRKNIGNMMLRHLKNDGQRFRNHINIEASYYAKDAFRYVYSELDFTPIIQAVDDPNFEYALNESVAAYDNSLFLAAVSTAGTALEALIIRILELEGTTVNDNSPTELGTLSGMLKTAGVIDKRDKRRIMLAANFRNLASHTNKGRVIRQDAKLLYQEIFNLVSNYFRI